MKTKLQALIAEQKEWIARLEGLVNETTAKPYAFIGSVNHDDELRKYFNKVSIGNCDLTNSAFIYWMPLGNVKKICWCMQGSTTHDLLKLSHNIIDLNEQPDFLEELSDSDKPNNPNPKKVYIKGHPTRGAEVIKMLENLGGVNRLNKSGKSDKSIYYLAAGVIISGGLTQIYALKHYTELHLPEDVSEVDPPTEEVELIEGEVYMNLGLEPFCPFIFKEYRETQILAHALINYTGKLEFNELWGVNSHKRQKATPEQRKQLFDALEKAGKHFNKEKMQLLDVEEWSCKQGLPIIVRNETSNWRADIFHSYDAVDAKYPYCCNSSDECDRLYKLAMPYTEENIYFLGTNKNPDKHYKFVEK